MELMEGVYEEEMYEESYADEYADGYTDGPEEGLAEADGFYEVTEDIDEFVFEEVEE